jgi:serine/threonine-protein kinase RsbW
MALMIPTPRDEAAFSFDMNGDPAGIARLSAWIDSVTAQPGFAPSLVYAVRLCAEELVSNAILHGRLNNHFRIRISIHPAPRMIVEDNGTPFDPTKVVAAPLASRLELAVPGGQGLTLVRHFSNAFAYTREDGWNRTEITFARPD